MNKIVITTIACLMAASFAQAEIAVVVSPSSGLSSMTKKEVQQIFLGKTKKFSNGQSAVPISQSSGGSTDEFNRKILSKSASQLKSYWSKIIFTGKGTPPKDVGNSAEVKKLVSSNPNMIGYIDGSETDGSTTVVLTIN